MRRFGTSEMAKPVPPTNDNLADEDEWRSPDETARLRDEALRRLMKMPPKPQKEMKVGRPRRRRAEPDGTIAESQRP